MRVRYKAANGSVSGEGGSTGEQGWSRSQRETDELVLKGKGPERERDPEHGTQTGREMWLCLRQSNGRSHVLRLVENGSSTLNLGLNRRSGSTISLNF
jgi:hypothetical protein